MSNIQQYIDENLTPVGEDRFQTWQFNPTGLLTGDGSAGSGNYQIQGNIIKLNPGVIGNENVLDIPIYANYKDEKAYGNDFQKFFNERSNEFYITPFGMGYVLLHRDLIAHDFNELVYNDWGGTIDPNPEMSFQGVAGTALSTRAMQNIRYTTTDDVVSPIADKIASQITETTGIHPAYTKSFINIITRMLSSTNPATLPGDDIKSAHYHWDKADEFVIPENKEDHLSLIELQKGYHGIAGWVSGIIGGAKGGTPEFISMLPRTPKWIDSANKVSDTYVGSVGTLLQKDTLPQLPPELRDVPIINHIDLPRKAIHGVDMLQFTGEFIWNVMAPGLASAFESKEETAWLIGSILGDIPITKAWNGFKLARATAKATSALRKANIDPHNLNRGLVAEIAETHNVPATHIDTILTDPNTIIAFEELYKKYKIPLTEANEESYIKFALNEANNIEHRIDLYTNIPEARGYYSITQERQIALMNTIELDPKRAATIESTFNKRETPFKHYEQTTSPTSPDKISLTSDTIDNHYIQFIQEYNALIDLTDNQLYAGAKGSDASNLISYKKTLETELKIIDYEYRSAQLLYVDSIHLTDLPTLNAHLRSGEFTLVNGNKAASLNDIERIIMSGGNEFEINTYRVAIDAINQNNRYKLASNTQKVTALMDGDYLTDARNKVLANQAHIDPTIPYDAAKLKTTLTTEHTRWDSPIYTDPKSYLGDEFNQRPINIPLPEDLRYPSGINRIGVQEYIPTKAESRQSFYNQYKDITDLKDFGDWLDVVTEGGSKPLPKEIFDPVPGHFASQRKYISNIESYGDFSYNEYRLLTDPNTPTTTRQNIINKRKVIHPEIYEGIYPLSPDPVELRILIAKAFDPLETVPTKLRAYAAPEHPSRLTLYTTEESAKIYKELNDAYPRKENLGDPALPQTGSDSVTRFDLQFPKTEQRFPKVIEDQIAQAIRYQSELYPPAKPRVQSLGELLNILSDEGKKPLPKELFERSPGYEADIAGRKRLVQFTDDIAYLFPEGFDYTQYKGIQFNDISYRDYLLLTADSNDPIVFQRMINRKLSDQLIDQTAIPSKTLPLDPEIAQLYDINYHKLSEQRINELNSYLYHHEVVTNAMGKTSTYVLQTSKRPTPLDTPYRANILYHGLHDATSKNPNHLSMYGFDPEAYRSLINDYNYLDAGLTHLKKFQSLTNDELFKIYGVTRDELGYYDPYYHKKILDEREFIINEYNNYQFMSADTIGLHDFPVIKRALDKGDPNKIAAMTDLDQLKFLIYSEGNTYEIRVFNRGLEDIRAANKKITDDQILLKLQDETYTPFGQQHTNLKQAANFPFIHNTIRTFDDLHKLLDRNAATIDQTQLINSLDRTAIHADMTIPVINRDSLFYTKTPNIPTPDVKPEPITVSSWFKSTFYKERNHWLFGEYRPKIDEYKIQKAVFEFDESYFTSKIDILNSPEFKALSEHQQAVISDQFRREFYYAREVAYLATTHKRDIYNTGIYDIYHTNNNLPFNREFQHLHFDQTTRQSLVEFSNVLDSYKPVLDSINPQSNTVTESKFRYHLAKAVDEDPTLIHDFDLRNPNQILKYSDPAHDYISIQYIDEKNIPQRYILKREDAIRMAIQAHEAEMNWASLSDPIALTDTEIPRYVMRYILKDHSSSANAYAINTAKEVSAPHLDMILNNYERFVELEQLSYLASKSDDTLANAFIPMITDTSQTHLSLLEKAHLRISRWMGSRDDLGGDLITSQTQLKMITVEEMHLRNTFRNIFSPEELNLFDHYNIKYTDIETIARSQSNNPLPEHYRSALLGEFLAERMGVTPQDRALFESFFAGKSNPTSKMSVFGEHSASDPTFYQYVIEIGNQNKHRFDPTTNTMQYTLRERFIQWIQPKYDQIFNEFTKTYPDIFPHEPDAIRSIVLEEYHASAAILESHYKAGTLSTTDYVKAINELRKSTDLKYNFDTPLFPDIANTQSTGIITRLKEISKQRYEYATKFKELRTKFDTNQITADDFDYQYNKLYQEYVDQTSTSTVLYAISPYIAETLSYWTPFSSTKTRYPGYGTYITSKITNWFFNKYAKAGTSSEILNQNIYAPQHSMSGTDWINRVIGTLHTYEMENRVFGGNYMVHFGSTKDPTKTFLRSNIHYQQYMRYIETTNKDNIRLIFDSFGKNPELYDDFIKNAALDDYLWTQKHIVTELNKHNLLVTDADRVARNNQIVKIWGDVPPPIGDNHWYYTLSNRDILKQTYDLMKRPGETRSFDTLFAKIESKTTIPDTRLLNRREVLDILHNEDAITPILTKPTDTLITQHIPWDIQIARIRAYMGEMYPLQSVNRFTTGLFMGGAGTAAYLASSMLLGNAIYYILAQNYKTVLKLFPAAIRSTMFYAQYNNFFANWNTVSSFWQRASSEKILDLMGYTADENGVVRKPDGSVITGLDIAEIETQKFENTRLMNIMAPAGELRYVSTDKPVEGIYIYRMGSQKFQKDSSDPYSYTADGELISKDGDVLDFSGTTIYLDIRSALEKDNGDLYKIIYEGPIYETQGPAPGEIKADIYYWQSDGTITSSIPDKIYKNVSDEFYIGLPVGVPFEAYVSRVIDGDTIEITYGMNPPIVIRLLGVDTPETDGWRNNPTRFGDHVDQQTLTLHGNFAKKFVQEILEGRNATILIPSGSFGYDRYGRILAYVNYSTTSGDSIDLSYALIANGLGRKSPYTDPMNDTLYSTAERIAKGIGSLDDPFTTDPENPGLGIWFDYKKIKSKIQSQTNLVLDKIHYEIDLSARDFMIHWYSQGVTKYV
ncbi:thermonuclease family protein [Bacteroides sp.]|uniref:thermonuclease family protein n=1 Tax=Bacteroides sp. TaxID=29523 RepID=UPI0026277E23|nr:thermonuclease family protein [Bacteroides sp.]MDD3039009.1 thermonuclease family protein [Bacteroides sp.]